MRQRMRWWDSITNSMAANLTKLWEIVEDKGAWHAAAQGHKVKVTRSCLTLCNPMDYTVHGILQARLLEWVAFPFSRGSSQPRDQTQVGGFFTSWAPRRPKNTGVGSLSLLLRIFSTQEWNQGLLHYRQSFYQLSYQGSYHGHKELDTT